MSLPETILRRVAARVDHRRPLDHPDIARAERLLEAALPSGLRDLYLACGNGGFGPGVRALVEGDDEQAIGELPDPQSREETSRWEQRWGHWEEWSIVRVTRVFHAWASDPANHHDAEPPGLYRFFAWGCAIESCVDTPDASLRVVRLDPAFYSASEEKALAASRLRGFVDHVPAYKPPLVSPLTRHCYHLESTSLLEWFDVWLEGHSLADLQGMAPQRARWLSRRPAP